MVDGSAKGGRLSGDRDPLFHWGWLLFFAGIPFLGWSAPGLLLILFHWATVARSRSVPGLAVSSRRASAPILYRVAVWGLVASYAVSVIPAVGKIDALGAGIGFGLLLFLGMNYIFAVEERNPNWWHKYLWCMPFTGLASALLGLYQYVRTPIRVTGLEENPNAYSTALLVSLYLGAAAFSVYKDFRRWLVIPYVAVLIAALLVTGSRGAWVGAMAGMVVFILLLVVQQWTISRRRALMTGFIGLLIAASIVAIVYTSVGPAIQVRMLSVVDIDANKDRVELYGTMARMIKAHPWFGVGMGNIKFRFAEFMATPRGTVHDIAHNYLLQSLAETGIVGTLFLLLLWVVWLGLGWPAGGSAPALLLLYSLLVGLFVRDQFDGSLSIFYVAFVLNWLGGTLVGARAASNEGKSQ